MSEISAGLPLLLSDWWQSLSSLLLAPESRTFWGYWLSAALIVLLWTTTSWASRKHYLKPWFTLSYWWNTSTRQEYALIVLNALLFSFLGLSNVFLIIQIAINSNAFFSSVFPAINLSDNSLVATNSAVLISIYAVILFLVDDASRYGLHRLLHSRWLWRIHRVHHSAQVLTPFTLLRLHPLEQLLYQLRLVLVHGVLTGAYFFIIGSTPELWLIFGVSGFIWLFNMAGANLRHSNIPLRYGKLEVLFISPAQHQLHHGVGGIHYNYGSVLAIWDYLFNSWHSGKHDFALPNRNMPLIKQLLLKR